ncbi:MAG: hypothetical protein AAFV53_14400 [Myxococcota bacterium]
MFDNRYHFGWRKADEPSWLSNIEALQLTPSAKIVRARLRSRAELAETPAFYPAIGLMHRGPLDPLGVNN